MTPIAPHRWLRVYFPRPEATRRLLIFPHGGGSASFYRPLARELPLDVEGVIVQYPGREDRLEDPHCTTMDSLVEDLAEAVGCLFDRSVTFFGHSMGASVAHEVTRRLTHRGAALPQRLIASGRPGPERQTPDDKHLDDDRLWDDVCRLGGTHERLLELPEVRAMVLPSIRADYRLVETYEATLEADLTIPVSAIHGVADPEVSDVDARAWAGTTTGAFDVRGFEGDHFYLRNRGEQALIGWLGARLEQDRAPAYAGIEERTQR